jgi:hypothetical protein
MSESASPQDSAATSATPKTRHARRVIEQALERAVAEPGLRRREVLAQAQPPKLWRCRR